MKGVYVETIWSKDFDTNGAKAFTLRYGGARASTDKLSGTGAILF